MHLAFSDRTGCYKEHVRNGLYSSCYFIHSKVHMFAHTCKAHRGRSNLFKRTLSAGFRILKFIGVAVLQIVMRASLNMSVSGLPLCDLLVHACCRCVSVHFAGWADAFRLRQCCRHGLPQNACVAAYTNRTRQRKEIDRCSISCTSRF